MVIDNGKMSAKEFKVIAEVEVYVFADNEEDAKEEFRRTFVYEADSFTIESVEQIKD